MVDKIDPILIEESQLGCLDLNLEFQKTDFRKIPNTDGNPIRKTSRSSFKARLGKTTPESVQGEAGSAMDEGR